MRDQIFFVHGGTWDLRKFTLAAIRTSKNHLCISASLCSHNDNFCKKIGRDIASGRLNKNKHIVNYVFNSNKLSPIQALITYANQMTTSVKFIKEFELE